MKFATPRKATRTLTSTRGHSIEFPGKGSLTAETCPAHVTLDKEGLAFVHVPPEIRQEAADAGLVPDSEMAEPVAVIGPQRPESADEFKKALSDVFTALAKSGDREVFGGNGVPKDAAVSHALGYKVERHEIKELWPMFQNGTLVPKA